MKRMSLWLGALGALTVLVSDTKADEQVDINLLSGAGYVVVSNSAVDIGQISNVFDGDTNTIARSASINPMVITLAFDHPRTFTQLRTFFHAGVNRWRVDAADSAADLDAGTGSFLGLVDWKTDGEWAWSASMVATQAPRSILRFQINRLTGDDYVHLNELEVYAEALPFEITGMQISNSTLNLEWSCNPASWYCVQQSSNLSAWADVEFKKSADYVAPWMGTLPTSQKEFWRVRMAQPEERASILKRVLVMNFDPILENHGSVRLSSYLGWNDAAVLTTNYLADIKEVSGNYVDWEIVQVLNIDEFPPKLDPSGWRYTDESYVDAWEGSGSWHSPDGMDYGWMVTTPITSFTSDVPPLAEFGVRNLNELVADGFIDEVIVWGGPYFGYYESRMVGATAYWCNSGGLVYEGVPLYVVMGLNYERAEGEAIHSFCHRAESIMVHVYGSWSSDATINHLWDKFTRNEAQHSVAVSGVGNVHYPPNGKADYDYDNDWNVVESDAPDWQDNYPDFLGTTDWVDNYAWISEWPEHSPQRSYLKWWLNHMPKQPGRYSDPGNATNDGKLNNWWGYLLDMNEYVESR
ncbi:MAG: hypothetical protein K9M45_07075 [Kiritimatiellales bacterium]|nr:hypothetical protein [Kiritimatiellales bacterium]